MTRARAALRLVDENGELVDTTDPHEENKALRQALVRLTNENRALKAAIERSRKTYAARQRLDDWFTDHIHELVEAGFKGKSRCKLTDDRFDAMKSIIEAGYTEDQQHWCSVGIARFPHVVYGKRRASGAPDSVETDIGWTCRRASRFEEAARLGALWLKEHP